MVDRSGPGSGEAESWVRARLPITGPLEHFQTEPWASVYRAETDDGTVWFKACAPSHAFEVALTAALSDRWTAVTDVLAHDADRGWLLMADAGRPLWDFGNPPERWLEILPRYAELQIGEAAHADGHLAAGVPDLRLSQLPARYQELLASDLPLELTEVAALAALQPRFVEACGTLDADGPGATVQHDDLHMNNVYVKDDVLRVLDWGDASISQPFFSLFETFRFLVQENGLAEDDPWFARLRDAYLEPWGGSDRATFELAFSVSGLAHSIACLDQRSTVPDAERAEFDEWFAGILRLGLRGAAGTG
jgi:hypothetical protein